MLIAASLSGSWTVLSQKGIIRWDRGVSYATGKAESRRRNTDEKSSSGLPC